MSRSFHTMTLAELETWVETAAGPTENLGPAARDYWGEADVRTFPSPRALQEHLQRLRAGTGARCTPSPSSN